MIISVMLRRLSAIVFLLFFCLSGYAQPIIYQLPRSTERKVEKWIRKLPRASQDSVLFQIGNVPLKKPDYSIVCSVLEDEWWTTLAHLSNRYLKIKSQYYPVILDYDASFAFTQEQLSAISGGFGHRDGLIQRVAVLFPGKVLHFKTKRSPRSLDKANQLPEVSQKASSRIVYFLSDDIEAALKTYFYSLSDQAQSTTYVVLSREEKQLFLTFYNDERERGVSTNRFLLIDEKTVPLYFDHDKALCFAVNYYDNRFLPSPQYRVILSLGNITVQSFTRNAAETMPK